MPTKLKAVGPALDFHARAGSLLPSVRPPALLAAAFFLVWAVGLAERTAEPWGDSPRTFYATIADPMLWMGTLLLAAVMPELRKARLWRKVVRWEWLVYLASAVMVAVPIVIAASNSFDASANGAGGPPVLLVVLGGVGLTAGLATLMRRRTQIGLLVAALLAAALMAGAIITAR